MCCNVTLTQTGPWFNIKMSSYQYRKSHCGDKTILRPSYLHNGISYTGKTTSLYWIGAQVIQHYCAEPISYLCLIKVLIHWGRDKIATISQTKFSNAFSWMKNIWISINISLKFVTKVRINNIPALVQIMARHRPGDKPLCDPMMVSLLTCYSASMS